MHDEDSAEQVLRTVRRLVDLSFDDLGGLVATSESPDAEGMPRRFVRLVLLQAVCGVRADIDFARRLRDDIACREFIGLRSGEAVPTAAECAHVRERVLGVAGFGEFLGVLLGVLVRRGLLDEAVFMPDRALLADAATPVP